MRPATGTEYCPVCGLYIYPSYVPVLYMKDFKLGCSGGAVTAVLFALQLSWGFVTPLAADVIVID
jgi:hypothetical protein